jgi:WD40 repeat protein
MRLTDIGTRTRLRMVFILGALLLATISPVAFANQPARPEPGERSQTCVGWVASLSRTQSLAAPAGDRPTSIQRHGETVIPNGRIITPAGTSLTVAPHPYGLTISPDGKTVVTANSGVSPFSISVASGVDSSTPSVRQIPPGISPAPDVLNAVFMGLAIAQDNRTLYASGGNDGTIAMFDLASGARTATIDVNVPAGGRAWKDSYIGDLKLSPDGKTLWALDQANFRIVGVDLASQSVAKVAATGRYPFGLALTPDGKTAYVANVGMYQYSFGELCRNTVTDITTAILWHDMGA